MIQNIEPHVYRNEYVPEPPKEDSVILYYEGRKILVKIEDQEISFLTFKEAAVYNPDVYEEYTYLFSIDGQGYYLAEGIDSENFPGFELKDNQYFREARPKYRQFAAVTDGSFTAGISRGSSAVTADSRWCMTTKSV